MLFTIVDAVDPAEEVTSKDALDRKYGWKSNEISTKADDRFAYVQVR